MGHTKRASKGDVSISNCRGWIRLRWRYAGERYSLNLPLRYLPENMHHATIKVAEIKLDMLKGCFDTTLEKYKAIPAAHPITQQVVIQKPKEEPTKKIEAVTRLKDLIPKFNIWATAIRHIDVENTVYYLSARNLLEKWGDFPIEDFPVKLSKENYAVSTYNDRLSCINNFFTWLFKRGHIPYNPLEDVNRRKKKRKSNPKRAPLEEHEILILLEAIKNDKHCPETSGYKHSFYYPFLAFIFYTGVRNAEAIGLRVKHVDLKNKQVEISESFARTVKGSNHAARIQKGTKTENVRYLPLTDELITLLEKQIAGKQPGDFVFPSPNGLSIDDRMLKRRILKPVLKKLELAERDLYAARHSFGTRAVQQGMALTDVAYLMGHTTVETAMRNYVSVSKPAVVLPSIRDKSK